VNVVDFLADRFRDFFNPGEAELNVPPLEGPLKPNDALGEAHIAAELPEVDNLVLEGAEVLFTSGADLWKVGGGVAAGVTKVRTFAHPVSALTTLAGGGLAAGLDGHGIVIVGGPHDGATFTELEGKPILAVTDLAEIDGALWVTEGSVERRASEWVQDLMGKRRTGRISRLDLATRKSTVIASKLGWPAGIARATGGDVLVSLAWEHKLVRYSTVGGGGGSNGARPTIAWRNLPGYPGRLRRARGGGYWLTVFAMRTKLVELVLQEDEYRMRMMNEIEPRYWVAPALAALDDHWEPLQGGGIKQLGIIKPWAPPRSYGLVVRLDENGEATGSYHSRAGERRHGITSVLDSAAADAVYVTSKGNGVVLKLAAPAVTS
jgi:hypothetical protein